MLQVPRWHRVRCKLWSCAPKQRNASTRPDSARPFLGGRASPVKPDLLGNSSGIEWGKEVAATRATCVYDPAALPRAAATALATKGAGSESAGARSRADGPGAGQVNAAAEQAAVMHMEGAQAPSKAPLAKQVQCGASAPNCHARAVSQVEHAMQRAVPAEGPSSGHLQVP